jgi:hypothetical protein
MHAKDLEMERRRYQKAAEEYSANIRDAQKNAAALKKAIEQLAKANQRIKELKLELARAKARKNGKV